MRIANRLFCHFIAAALSLLSAVIAHAAEHVFVLVPAVAIRVAPAAVQEDRYYFGSDACRKIIESKTGKDDIFNITTLRSFVYSATDTVNEKGYNKFPTIELDHKNANYILRYKEVSLIVLCTKSGSFRVAGGGKIDIMHTPTPPTMDVLVANVSNLDYRFGEVVGSYSIAEAYHPKIAYDPRQTPMTNVYFGILGFVYDVIGKVRMPL